MFAKLSLGIITCILMMVSCNQAQQKSTQILLRWKLNQNHLAPKAHHQAAFHVVNKSSEHLQGGWTLYFNSLAVGSEANELPKGFNLDRKSGDFYALQAPKSASIAPGDSMTISYQANRFIEKDSDAPIAPYLVTANQEKVIDLTKHFDKQSISLERKIESYGNKANLLPTAEQLYEQNKELRFLEKRDIAPFVPQPASYEYLDGSFQWNEPLKIAAEASFEEAHLLFIHNLKKHSISAERVKTEEEASIRLKVSSQISNPEGYILNISKSGIHIEASGKAGAHYAFQSLLALILDHKSKKEIPAIRIEDEPRFSHRALFLDIARNFQQKGDIRRLIDLMSFYKLNVLQLHLSNDEAWRIEIPDLPELTEIASKRGHSSDEQNLLWPYYGSGPDPENSPYGSGYLSKTDFIEILQYAHARHVTIIPEIVAPGHMKAAILAMKLRYERLLEEGKTEEAETYLLQHPSDQSEYMSVQNYANNTMDVCMESSYRFYEKVLDEILGMYAEADVPIEVFHTGGDEVPTGAWEGSPACADWADASDPMAFREALHHRFYNRLHEMLTARDLQLAGWEEVGQRLVIEEGKGSHHEPDPVFVGKNFRLHAWNAVVSWRGTDMAYQLANAGYEVVLSNSSNLYFDLAYNRHPAEPGLNWSGYVNTRSSWQMTPYNHFISNERDIYGNEIKPEELAANHVALSAEGRERIIGLQGQLWSETIKGPDMMFRSLLPKMLGLVERAWSPQPSWATEVDSAKRKEQMEADWNRFANTLGQFEIPRLSSLFGGYTTRIPEAGMQQINGVVHVNTTFPGLQIRYTLDGSEPTPSSELYTAPINLENNPSVRSKVFGAGEQQSRAQSLFGKK